MVEARFQKILLYFCVTAGGLTSNELLGLAGWDSQIEHQRFAGEIVYVVFQMFDPVDESRTIFGAYARGLVREIRADVAVDEDDLALVQGGFQAELRFEAVACVQQGAEVRVYGFERAKIAVEELADHFAEPGVVLRESGGIDGMAAGGESFFEQVHLGAFAAAVDSFNGDKFSR